MMCKFCKHRRKDSRCHEGPPVQDQLGAWVFPLVKDKDSCGRFRMAFDIDLVALETEAKAEGML